MKKISRFACFLLVVLLACGLILTSCTVDENTDTSAGETSQDPFKDENGKYVAKTSGTNYGGIDVKVLSCGVNDTYNSEIVKNDYETVGNPKEKLPDVINEAIGLRIQTVNEMLGVNIIEEYVHDGKRMDGDMANKIRTDQIAGLVDYVIIAPNICDAATLATTGHLANLYDLPGIQMDAPWWDQNFNKTMTINGQLYFAIGDIGTINKSATAALTFNKDMYINYGMVDRYGGLPYDLVKNGTWTIEIATQMAQEISEDINNNPGIDIKDKYGWGGQLDDLWSMFYGSGSRIASTDTNDGYPVLTMYSERSARVMEKIQTLVQDKEHYISANDYFGFEGQPWPTILVRDNFIAGNVLFYNGSMSTPIELGDMKQAYGLLPIPKGDAEQDGYYSMINAWVTDCFAVPNFEAFSDNYEEEFQLASDVLNAMGAVSANIVSPAYIEQCLELMKTHDQETIDMIENYILPTRGCDIGMVYKWGGLDQLIHDMSKKQIGTFASEYQGLSDTAQMALEETIAAFKALG